MSYADAGHQAMDPPTAELPMGGASGGNQPPPPPPESDPNQEYGEQHMGIARPQTNDANRPGQELHADWFPDDPATHGVRASALDSA